MSPLALLDATRICSRWSESDPQAWVLPAPPMTRRPGQMREGAPAAAHGALGRGFSWLSLARNPRAALVTGFAAPLLAADAVARRIAAA
jgi:hypothetical protein